MKQMNTYLESVRDLATYIATHDDDARTDTGDGTPDSGQRLRGYNKRKRAVVDASDAYDQSTDAGYGAVDNVRALMLSSITRDARLAAAGGTTDAFLESLDSRLENLRIHMEKRHRTRRAKHERSGARQAPTPDRPKRTKKPRRFLGWDFGS